MSKKESILNAALKLFVENGFHGTATSKIAQEAGVANGTLFQYFKTKDELVVNLYIQIKEELADYIESNSSSESDIKEALKSQMLSSLFWALDHTTKFSYIQQFHTSPYIAQVEQEILSKQTEPHFKLIQAGINQGVLKPLPADLIYLLMSSQIFGLHQFVTSKKLSKAEQHETIQTTFEMLWTMIT